MLLFLIFSTSIVSPSSFWLWPPFCLLCLYPILCQNHVVQAAENLAISNWETSNQTLAYYVNQFRSVPPIAYSLHTVPPVLSNPAICGWGKKRDEALTGRIIDVTLFNNEFDVMEARVYELADIVDLFIVYEDEVTFTGQPKTRSFPAFAGERLAPFIHKIIYVDGSATRAECIQATSQARGKSVDAFRTASFSCEINTRNSLIKFIPGGPQANDMIMMSDTDEIVDRHWLRSLRYCSYGNQCTGFTTRTHHYSLHWPAVSHNFKRSACPGNLVGSQWSMQDMQDNVMRRKVVTEDFMHGWHLSYFGSPHFIRMKLMSYAEAQTNRAPYNELTYISNHAHSGVELLERPVLVLKYQKSADISAPWFVKENFAHRHMFDRYGKQEDAIHKPPCLILKSVSGQIGNQLFAIGAVVARAYQLGVPYVMPTQLQDASRSRGSSVAYWDHPGLDRIMMDALEPRDCKPVGETVTLHRFQALPAITGQRNMNSSIALEGVIMQGKDIYPFAPLLRNRLESHVGTEWKKQYSGRNLMIGVCGGKEESHAEWEAIAMRYYEKALPKVLRDDHTVHIFGDDDGGERLAEKVRPFLKRKDQELKVWSGDHHNIDQTMNHLQYMMQCDDFVLCWSTFHIWGAYLTRTVNSSVVYPGWKEHNRWAHQIVVPHWEEVSF
eukprot:gene1537-1675_t